MKIFRRIFLIVACILALTSCATTKFISETTQPYSVNDMALLRPVAEISLIVSNDLPEYSESMSITTEDMLKRILMTNKTKVPVSEYVDMSHEQAQSIFNTMAYAEGKIKHLQGFRVSEDIRSLILSSGKRYGLLVMADGVSRSRQNYRKEAILGVAVAILSLGTVYYNSFKAITKLDVMIVDSETGEAVYFKTNGGQEIEPMDENRVGETLVRMFRKYTWE